MDWQSAVIKTVHVLTGHTEEVDLHQRWKKIRIRPFDTTGFPDMSAVCPVPNSLIYQVHPDDSNIISPGNQAVLICEHEVLTD